jgi:hypothetical protein
MACGCGGASTVYKAPASAGAAAANAAPSGGLPKVWNGPAPKQPAK